MLNGSSPRSATQEVVKLKTSATQEVVKLERRCSRGAESQEVLLVLLKEEWYGQEGKDGMRQAIKRRDRQSQAYA